MLVRLTGSAVPTMCSQRVHAAYQQYAVGMENAKPPERVTEIRTAAGSAGSPGQRNRL
jgi:hypothetical protein